MADTSNAFTKMVPGFDFLQGLVKNAGAALPNVGSWIAPTLNPEELEKRIDELRTVQFWLEQNARMLGATIQALEVQRMTLSTLKTMNVSLGDLTESLKMRVPDIAPRAPAAPAEPAPPPSPEPLRRPERSSRLARGDEGAAKAAAKAPAESAAAPAAAIVDPMQWWGALTKQFTELATNAMKETAADAAKNLAGAMLQQGVDAAGQTLKKAATMPVDMARGAAGLAQGAAETAARGAGTVAGAAAGAAESLGLGQPRRRGAPKR